MGRRKKEPRSVHRENIASVASKLFAEALRRILRTAARLLRLFEPPILCNFPHGENHTADRQVPCYPQQ